MIDNVGDLNLKKMQITFLGNFTVPYTSENHYLRTLRDLGHEVLYFQEGKAKGQEVLNSALKSDYFFWVHTHGWKPVTGAINIRELLGTLKKAKIPSFGYHLDLWMGIERQKDLYTDPYWKIDYFFSVDKSMVKFLNSNPRFPKSFYMPAGVLKNECERLEEYCGEFKHDVVFVGSRRYHSEWPYRPKLIDWLASEYGPGFAHYGGDGLGVVRGRELNAVYLSSKIVIGDTLCKGFNYPYYLSDRIFETTGRGGFIIHPYIKGLEDLFVVGKEIVVYEYNDFETLRNLIDKYLLEAEERETIRMAGNARTFKDHTYTNRLSDILNILAREKL